MKLVKVVGAATVASTVYVEVSRKVWPKTGGIMPIFLEKTGSNKGVPFGPLGSILPVAAVGGAAGYYFGDRTMEDALLGAAAGVLGSFAAELGLTMLIPGRKEGLQG